MKRFLTIAALGDGTQASRLRKSNQPTTAGETPAYQRKSVDTKLTIAVKAGVSYDVKLYKGLYVIPEDPDFRLFNQTFGITLGYRL